MSMEIMSYERDATFEHRVDCSDKTFMQKIIMLKVHVLNGETVRAHNKETKCRFKYLILDIVRFSSATVKLYRLQGRGK